MGILRAIATLVGLTRWASTDPAVRAHLAYVATFDDPFGHKARLRHG